MPEFSELWLIREHIEELNERRGWVGQMIQKLDVRGEINVQKLKRQRCGAELSRTDVTLGQGPVTVGCPYCGST